MSRIRRRRTKAETRLETLEGRITPTASSMQTVIGAQVLVPAPESGATPIGLTRAEAVALKHYERIHNAGRAEIFLSHHHRLEKWLERVPYEAPLRWAPNPTLGRLEKWPERVADDPTTPASPVSAGANTQASPTAQGTSTTSDQAGPVSTTPPSSSDNDQPTSTGHQAGNVTNQQGDATPENISSTTSAANGSSGSSSTVGVDSHLTDIYRQYLDGHIDEAISRYGKLVTITGNDFLVQIYGHGNGDISLLDEVESLDSQISVEASSAAMVVADVPIADLPKLEAHPDYIESINAQPPMMLLR